MLFRSKLGVDDLAIYFNEQNYVYLDNTGKIKDDGTYRYEAYNNTAGGIPIPATSKNNISVKYGITKYFHRAYYLTNKEIFGYYPNYFLSFLMQFIAISKSENNFLILSLDKYIRKNRMQVGEWITKIVMKSVVSAHKIYNGSMFSEYEMIGFSNIFYQYNNQKIIKGFRDHLNGKLSVCQKVILRFFDYKFIAYEHSHQNQNSRGMLKRTQTWCVFFKLLINSLSNNYFRTLKHYYYLIIIKGRKKKNFLYR